MFLIRTKKGIISVIIVAIVITALCFIGEKNGFYDDTIYTEADIYGQEGNLTPDLILNKDGSQQKIAYLTFDDGPSANTSKILDALAEYDAKATFFVLGERVEANTETLLRIFNEGHSIGNHSFSHNYDKVYGTREEFEQELTMWEDAVEGVIGKENMVKLLRFPGGSKDKWKYIYRRIATEMGYKFVDWNALNGDADGKPFSKERCMEEIRKYCTEKGNVVILMHDSAKKGITAEMMPEILSFLKSEGYIFKRIEI